MTPDGHGQSAPPAPLALPLCWEAWVRVSRPELEPPAGPLAWPDDHNPVVRISPRREAMLPAVGGLHPDLLVAEIDSEDELLQVAEAARELSFAALVLVGPRVPPEAVSEAQALAPEMALVPRPAPGEPVTGAAGRSLEELVRRRVYRVLLAHWRQALSQYESELFSFGVTAPVPPPRPTMAPLSTIEQAHVVGVLGLWWPGESKSWQGLGVSRKTVRHVRSRLPEALRAALGEPLELARRTLKLLVVEDDPGLGEATRRLLVALGEKRLGRGIEASLVTSGEAARRHMLDSGDPDIVWVDMQLETPRAGLDLVRWMRMRAASSVVLGKTARAPPEDIRDLTRLGAVSVWTSSRPKELNALLADAARISDEAVTIAALERRTRSEEARLWPAAGRGLLAVAALEDVVRTRKLVEMLETDLHAPMPALVRQPEASLDEVRAEAAKMALASSDGNVSQAARMLGIDWRRMREYASRGSKKRREG